MTHLRVYEPGEPMPPNLRQAGAALDELRPHEAEALVAAGVWEAGSAGNWARMLDDGSVWAGGSGKLVARVRGKNGRRLRGDCRRLAPEDRRRTVSMNLSAVARENLKRIAERESQATGRKVTPSTVVERWARELGDAAC